MTEETQVNQGDETFALQKKRFYNETKKRGKKYMEGLRPLIDDETLKVKGLSQHELLTCLNDALGQWEFKNAERSAKENRKKYH